MDQTSVDPAQVQRMIGVMAPLFGIVIIVAIAALIVPFWVAFKKAGLSPWLSMLIFIPGVGLLVTLYVLAFAKWRVVAMPPEYPAYPAPAYGQPRYPPQVYTQPGTYPAPAAPTYPPSAAPTYPPTDPPRDL